MTGNTKKLWQLSVDSKIYDWSNQLFLFTFYCILGSVLTAGTSEMADVILGGAANIRNNEENVLADKLLMKKYRRERLRNSRGRNNPLWDWESVKSSKNLDSVVTPFICWRMFFMIKLKRATKRSYALSPLLQILISYVSQAEDHTTTLWQILFKFPRLQSAGQLTKLLGNCAR